MELPVAATQDKKQPSKKNRLIAASPESMHGAHREAFALVVLRGI